MKSVVAANEKLTPLSHGAQNHCFGCGAANRTGLRLKFLVDEQQHVISRFKVPRRFEGPPGYVHGGVIATLLDEAMSKANRQRGSVAMTRQMEVEYLRPVPLNTPIRITAQHRSAAGRKHHCEAETASEDGIILARGRALLIAMAPGYLKQQSG